MGTFGKAAKLVLSARAGSYGGQEASCRYDGSTNTLVVQRPEDRGEPESWYRGAYTASISTSSSMLMLVGYLLWGWLVLAGAGFIQGQSTTVVSAIALAVLVVPGYICFRTARTIQELAGDMTVNVAFQDRESTDGQKATPEVP